MSKLEEQQEIEDQKYQYRIKVEQLQDDQLELRKKRHQIEELKEVFFELQMNEQAVYDLMITHSDPKERHFFEDHGNESLHLAKKAQQEFDEEWELLKKNERLLSDQEEKTRQEQQNFLKMNRKVRNDGN